MKRDNDYLLSINEKTYSDILTAIYVAWNIEMTMIQCGPVYEANDSYYS